MPPVVLRKKKPGRASFGLVWVVFGIFLTLPFLLPLSAMPAQKPVADISYTVSIQGELDQELKDWLVSLSDSFSFLDRPPASLNILWNRLARDRKVFQKALRSRGYFEARVGIKINDDKLPVETVFLIETGPVFRFSKVDLSLSPALSIPEADRPDLEGLGDLGLEEGNPYFARDVVSAQQNLLTRLGEQGFPFAKVENRKILADHSSQTVSVFFTINPGPLVTFGKTTIQGLVSLDESIARKQLPWEEGDRFNVSLLVKARASLVATGFFSDVRVNYDRYEQSRFLPVKVTLKERKHRTLRTGVGYSSDLGPEANLSWEHRNLFGGAERYRAALKLSRTDNQLSSTFRKPRFFREDLTLVLHSALSRK